MFRQCEIPAENQLHSSRKSNGRKRCLFALHIYGSAHLQSCVVANCNKLRLGTEMLGVVIVTITPYVTITKLPLIL